jgi:hypothetical protein
MNIGVAPGVIPGDSCVRLFEGPSFPWPDNQQCRGNKVAFAIRNGTTQGSVRGKDTFAWIGLALIIIILQWNLLHWR